MDKRTEFKLRFTEPDGDDWLMILRTTEPQTEDAIRNLIDIHSDIINTAHDDYSPVDIMDRICDDKGWMWEDMDWQEMEIVDWK